MSEVSRCPEHVSFAKWELGEFPSESWGQLGVGGSLKVADWGLLVTLAFSYLLGSIPIIDPQSHPGKGLLRPVSCGLLIVAARRGRCCLEKTDRPCSGISVFLLGVLPCMLQRAPCFCPLCPRRTPGEAVHLSSVIANRP